MATGAVALPTFIHEDVPTQSLLDELRRLEEERAHLQAAHIFRESDDTAAMLQYYGMELDEVGFIIRDRLWALILGRGEDADDARVQGFFTTLTTHVQSHVQAEAEATVPSDLIDELDEATVPSDLTDELDEADIALLQLIFDEELLLNDHIVHVSAPASPVVAPAPLPQLPPVVLAPPIVFPVVVTNTLPEV